LAAVGSGTYRSPFAPEGAPETQVAAFRLGVRQVTNAEFLAFVRARPEWRRDRVARLLADDGYLSHWAGPEELGPGAPADAPVTRVSWFAARAYARLHGLRLPTQAEWELAAAASATVADARRDPAFRQQILDWYARPNPIPLPAAGSGPANLWGVRDLHGLVWEWVDDFDAALLDGDLRGSASDDAVCGAGAIGAEDATDYGTFMRFAMRSALRGPYTTSSLGFRVAADAAEPVAHGCCSSSPPAPADAAASGTSTPGGSIYQLGLALRDQTGATVPLDAQRGRPVIISMFYGTCPAACPLLIEDLQALERALPERVRAQVRVLLVSFDPERDGPAVLAGLAERHEVDPARWTLASASVGDARELAAALGIRYRVRLQDGGFDHTSSLVVLDGAGVEVARVDGLGGATERAVEVLGRLAGDAPE
jgi:cytochrome oxidase Cu insertion factor (SCO1/SenC/PrrC family)